MKQKLQISVSKKPRTSGVITCGTVTLREKIFRFLFGKKQRVMILIPGDCVDEVAICDSIRGGEMNG